MDPKSDHIGNQEKVGPPNAEPHGVKRIWLNSIIFTIIGFAIALLVINFVL